MRTKRFLFNFIYLFITYAFFLVLCIPQISTTSIGHNIALFIVYATTVGVLHLMFQFTNFVHGASALHMLTKHNLVFTGSKKEFNKYGLFYFLYLKFTKNYLNLYTFISNEK